MRFIRLPVRWIRRICMQFIWASWKNINKVQWLLFQKKTCKRKYQWLFFECILNGQIFLQKFGHLVWKTKLMKSFANDGWDNYGDIWWIDQAFPDDISGTYTMTKNMTLEEIMKKVRTKTKIKKTIVTLWRWSSFEHL